MGILAWLKPGQFVSQTQIKTHFGQGNVGHLQTLGPLHTPTQSCLDDTFLEIEYRVLQPLGKNKTLTAWKIHRVRQKPQNKIMSADKDG